MDDPGRALEGAPDNAAIAARPKRRRSMSGAAVWLLVLGWSVVAVLLRPAPLVALAAICVLGAVLRWASRGRLAKARAVALVALGVIAVVRPHQDAAGSGRLFVDQTYHHQALRALNQVAAQGADVSEVLQTITHVRAGDADGWYEAWTDLGNRNLTRAYTTKDWQSRGQALLRTHSYYLRSEFFLPPDDPRRAASFARNTQAFYRGLDTLGIPYEKIAVPYESHHLNAVFYPAAAPARAPLIVFCGGYDSTLEELYFFLVASARARGYSVLTFEGPGQGSVLRDQGLTFTPEWEKPTSAVLDAYLDAHPRPEKLVLVGLSLGGYLAARAAAFDDRFDGLVAYDALFDAGAMMKRKVPGFAYTLRSMGLDGLVDFLAGLKGKLDPEVAWGLANGRWVLGKTTTLDVVDAFSAYTLEGVAGRIRQHVLLLAGEDDQFLPVDQLVECQRTMVNARSVTTRIYDRASGGAEHSQLGAPTLWHADLFDWMEERFGP